MGDRILFANSDLSGISIFEEAQYHGVEAAQKVLKNPTGNREQAAKQSLFVCNLFLPRDSHEQQTIAPLA